MARRVTVEVFKMGYIPTDIYKGNLKLGEGVTPKKGSRLRREMNELGVEGIKVTEEGVTVKMGADFIEKRRSGGRTTRVTFRGPNETDFRDVSMAAPVYSDGEIRLHNRLGGGDGTSCVTITRSVGKRTEMVLRVTNGPEDETK